MKTSITILGILYGALSFAQNCFCDKDSILSEIISCDTIKFDNQAKLFWNFNCDSSWLTFESPTNKKQIIFSLGDGLQNLTERLGYIYAQEYKSTFLIQNNTISGCCSPPDFYLFDKTTGQLKKSLGRIIFYSEDKKLPFIITVTNSNYEATPASNYSSLTVFNIDKDKMYFITLPKDELEKALEKTEKTYPEYLFDEPTIKDSIVTLTYYLRKPRNEKEKPIKKILIDFRKY